MTEETKECKVRCGENCVHFKDGEWAVRPFIIKRFDEL